MKFEIESGDLFELENDYYLVHCISSDFKLGAGIAKIFDIRYDMREKLLKTYKVNNYVTQCLLIDTTFNLVTKNRYWEKPTYASLKSSLILLKEEVLSKDITKLAMPLIGCGLDKLEWNNVSKIINEVFKDTNLEIKVRYI